MDLLVLLAAALGLYVVFSIGYRYLLLRQLDDEPPEPGPSAETADSLTGSDLIECPTCGTGNRRSFGRCRNCAGPLPNGS